MIPRAFLSLACAALAVAPAAARTRVIIQADTEDYTCDDANDGVRDFARTLTEEGVRGNFVIVGYLAARIQEFGRTDVIEALKPHVLGTHSMYHSRHPTPAEYGDLPNYFDSYRRALTEEATAKGMAEAVFGEGRVIMGAMPGHSMNLANFDAQVDLGVQIATGGFVNPDAGNVDIARPGTEVDGLWYFNQLRTPYFQGIFHLEYLIPGFPNYVKPEDYGKVLDMIARYDLAGIGFHPANAVKTRYWDGLNYRGADLVKWREWKQVPNRPPEVTAAFYRNLRTFLRALKADGRFELTDCEAIRRTFRPRTAIERSHLPAIRTALERDFNCIREPASWSVADCFQAATRFLRGEKAQVPGKAYGFLAQPRGVKEPAEVAAADLRAAAKTLDLATFLPPEIRVGGQTIGPADFLFAALEVLTTGAEKVTVRPREQLGSFKEVPSLETFRLKGVWLHAADYEDARTTDRLRWQLWTVRIEPTAHLEARGKM